jgi:hypothetical protein
MVLSANIGLRSSNACRLPALTLAEVEDKFQRCSLGALRPPRWALLS